MKFNNYLLALLGIAILLAGMACEKNPVETEDPTPPALPPAESMKLDLSTFGIPQGSLAKSADPTTQANFNNAVIRAAIVNTVVAVHMIVPSAIFAAALSEKPVLGQDGKFHWIFKVTVGLTTFEADLPVGLIQKN